MREWSMSVVDGACILKTMLVRSTGSFLFADPF